MLLRFDRRHLRDLLFASAIFAAMLGGYFAAYVTTPYDQTWHLASSSTRLAAQAWPLFLLAVFAGLHAPEATAPPLKRLQGKRPVRGRTDA